MLLRVDRRKLRRAVADTDDLGPGPHGGKRPVEEATAIAEPVTRIIKTDDRRDHHVRNAGPPFSRNRNPPDPSRQWLPGLPRMELQGQSFFHHDGQGGTAAQPGYFPHQRTKVRLSSKRPKGADDTTLHISDLGEDTGRDRFSGRGANLDGNGKTLRNQALALACAPALDIRPGRHVWRIGQSGVNGVDLMQKAGR